MTATTATGDLAKRIKAEFDARAARRQTAEQEQVKASQQREQRLAQFTKVCEDLKSVWGPRFEEFAQQFGDKVKISPSITSEQRQARVSFVTDLATMTMTLSASASTDVTRLVLDYDLLVIPMFFEYERHARMEMPLDKIDRDAIGKWIEDRLISCVKTYFSVQDNEYYVKRAMVEDPITKVKFLREDAKAQLEYAGKTYYFSSEDSLEKFKQQDLPPPKAPAASKPAPDVKSQAQPASR